MITNLFDVETNGFLPVLDRLHSLVIKNIRTEVVLSCHNHGATADYTIEDGLKILMDSDCIIGHNALTFDVPAIQKVYPWFEFGGKVRDTLVMSQLIWSDLKNNDFSFVDTKRGRAFPKKYIGKHSLAAWGHRLGEFKGEYTGGFDAWSPEMQEYCEQDVEVLFKLFNLIRSKRPTAESVSLEHDFASVLAEQERWGAPFNVEGGKLLYAELSGKRAAMERDLRGIFQPWFRDKGRVTPKSPRKMKRPDLGTVTFKRFGKTGQRLRDYVGPPVEEYTPTAPYCKVQYTEFKPSSQDHIADRLMKLRGWRPSEYGKNGKPSVTDEILQHLPYPEAKPLAEYLMVQKRIGSLAEGRQAWLKVVTDDGRIHGRIIHNGTPTSRCRHLEPNLTQVPKVVKPYGPECRSLFAATPGYKFVGTDASGQEVRLLSHFMYPFDGGAYADVVLNGDIHTVNQKAFGMYTRDRAKTGFYALLYGCYDKKLGEVFVEDAILAGKPRPSGSLTAVGKKGRAAIMGGLPALKTVINIAQEEVRKTGGLRGLDGRFHPSRSAHSALNLRIQGAGAVLMKKATVNLWVYLQEEGLTDKLFVGNDRVRQVIHAHDEFQLEVREDLAEQVGQLAAKAIKEAGVYFKLNVPMDGEYKIGSNWAETH